MALYSDARYSARVGLWAIRKWRVTQISMFILNPPWGNSSWCWVETWTGPRVRLQPPGIGHSQPPCFFRTRFHNQCNTLLPILLKKILCYLSLCTEWFWCYDIIFFIEYVGVDAFQGQHTRARERAGREGNEKQSRRRDRSDRSGAPVRPVT